MVDAGDVRVDAAEPTRMTVTLHALSEGVYTVSWKALSTIDGHQSGGTFPFAVGAASANAVGSIPQSSSARLPFSALLSKFLFLVSLAALLGHRLFIWLIWNPVLRSDQRGSSTAVSNPDVWAFVYRFGLIALLLSIGMGIYLRLVRLLVASWRSRWDPEQGVFCRDTSGSHLACSSGSGHV